MEFIQKIIDWIMTLLGLKKPAPEQGALPPAERGEIRRQGMKGMEEVEGAENIHVHGEGDSSKVIKKVQGADLVEDDGERLWVSRIDKEVPRERWQDVWGPLARVAQNDRLEEFCVHQREFDELHQGDPLAAEKKLLALGYSSVGEYFAVQATILKYYGTPSGPNVDDAVIDSQQFIDAMMRADARRRGASEAQFKAANAELLAPIEGVTVELYAQISARLAQGMQQPELMALLAQHGLDFAAWDRASKVWNDRMSKDTTATIAGIYGKAFMSSGQGQFGAAAQASAGAYSTGTAAGGAEPIPYEKACEIQGAMTAWSQSGKDVNALLKQKFGMVAAEWAAANTWWMTQLMADVARFDDYNRRCASYEAKYKDAGGGGDSDIQF